MQNIKRIILIFIIPIIITSIAFLIAYYFVPSVFLRGNFIIKVVFMIVLYVAVTVGIIVFRHVKKEDISNN